MNEERERNKSRPKLHSLNINREIKGKEWNSITMWGGGRKGTFRLKRVERCMLEKYSF